jgi:hypothetical protein
MRVISGAMKHRSTRRMDGVAGVTGYTDGMHLFFPCALAVE